jgi:hypothetical protein
MMSTHHASFTTVLLTEDRLNDFKSHYSKSAMQGQCPGEVPSGGAPPSYEPPGVNVPPYPYPVPPPVIPAYPYPPYPPTSAPPGYGQLIHQASLVGEPGSSGGAPSGESSMGLVVCLSMVSFIFPFVGWVIFFCSRVQQPRLAVSCGAFGTLGFLIALLAIVLGATAQPLTI